MAVLIPIITQYAGKGVERAIKEFQSLEKTSDRASLVLRKALIPGALAAGAALGGLGVTLFKTAKAAAEAQREDKLLADQLRRTTGATDQAIAATIRFVDALEMESTVSGGALSEALATLTRATGNVTVAQDQLRLATDISVGANLDLQAVSKALAKAYGGNFAALTKLGVPLDENIVKTKDYAAATAVLSKQFGGAAAGAADTFEGQLAKLKIGYEKIVEAVGELVLPVLERFVTAINKYVVPAVRVFIEQLTGGKGVKQAFEVAIASMGGFAPTVIEGMRAATNSMLEFVRKAALVYESIKAIQTAAKFFRGNITGALKDFGMVLAAAGGARLTRKMQDDTNTYFDGLLSRLEGLQVQAQATRSALDPTLDRLDRLSASIIAANKAAGGGDGEEEGGGGGGSGGGLNKLADRATKLKERLEEAAKVLREDMGRALETAQEQLANATQAFDEFADSVSRTINEALNFEGAMKESAEEGGGSFFDELTKQAERAKEFGALVERLLLADISKEALDQVLAAGVDSGTEIAKQLLAATDGVLRANTLVATTQGIAERIAKASAEKFYGAGVSNGQEYLRGVMEAIAEAERQIARAKRPADIKGAGATFSNTMSQLGARAATVNNFTINSQSLDPKGAGEVIVDALREYNQRSGYVGLNVFGG